VRRRFFVDRFDSGTATMCGDAAEHLGRVLRAAPGQLYELSDGQRVWLGRIERLATSKRGDSRIEFALVEPIEAREPALKLQLLLSIVKFDRFEWSLEKATELGVTEIFPMAAARSDKALLAAAGKRNARWEKILVESAQQSRRLRPPVVSAATLPEKAFANTSADVKIMLSERADALSLKHILRDYTANDRGASPTIAKTSASLAIGPEGGWTDEEMSAARTAGFVEASLGENILRTETAVIASLAILRFALGDWSASGRPFDMAEKNRGTDERLRAGLCADCLYARRVESDRRSVFFMCERSKNDARFAKYPSLPVVRCAGYEGAASDF
jgi:16S rRNA (uracil1498-N3)-methyltransferase